MRAILVSVDYTDLLRLTLPWNRHHFKEVYVVTSSANRTEVQDVCVPLDVNVVVTEKFYENGADFNKWAALEYGLDVMGRTGWLCLMDADVLWPKSVDWRDHAPTRPGQQHWLEMGPPLRLGQDNSGHIGITPGYLCSPLRRMCLTIPKSAADIPPETEWGKYNIHRNVNEWAGYSQIFHANDPVLGAAPWHETNWRHAGGADSFFQEKWPRERKVRAPFEVLHLGSAGTNWCGRAGEYADGSKPPDAEEKLKKLRGYILGRQGKPKVRAFDHEKI